MARCKMYPPEKDKHSFEEKQHFSRNEENSKLFRDIKGVVPIIQWDQNLLKIILTLTVFEINDISYFHQIQAGGRNLEKS